MHIKKEQLIDIDADATIKFPDGNIYSAKLTLSACIVPASVPCKKCRKSARQMLQEIGVVIDANDANVDMMEVIASLHDDERSITEDPQVLLIKDAFSENQYFNETLGKFEKHHMSDVINNTVSKRLAGQVLCIKCLHDKKSFDTIVNEIA